MENTKKLPLWRRVAMIAVLICIVFLVGLMLVTWISYRQLDNEILKINKAGEPTAFPVITSQKAAAEDANRYYAEAVGQIPPAELTGINKANLLYRIVLASKPINEFPDDLRDKVSEHLAKNQPVLSNLDKGAGLGLSSFDTGLADSASQRVDRLNSVQAVFLLSSLRTLDLIRAGNLDKAADSIAASVKLLRVFDSFPVVILQSRKMASLKLVCNDIQLLLQRDASSSDPNAPLPRAKRISPQRLETLGSLLEGTLPADTLEKTLLAERVYQIEIFRSFLSKNITSKYLSATMPVLHDRRALPGLTWHKMRVTRAATKFMRDMAWTIKLSHLPWPEPLEQAKDANLAPSGGKSGIASVIGPLTHLSAETFAVVRGTTTLIAIERYRQREKKFPDTLGLLIPAYMKSVPLDPFSGKPLVYSHDDKTCRLSGALEPNNTGRAQPGWFDNNQVSPKPAAVPK